MEFSQGSIKVDKDGDVSFANNDNIEDGSDNKVNNFIEQMENAKVYTAPDKHSVADLYARHLMGQNIANNEINYFDVVEDYMSTSRSNKPRVDYDSEEDDNPRMTSMFNHTKHIYRVVNDLHEKSVYISEDISKLHQEMFAMRSNFIMLTTPRLLSMETAINALESSQKNIVAQLARIGDELAALRKQG